MNAFSSCAFRRFVGRRPRGGVRLLVIGTVLTVLSAACVRETALEPTAPGRTTTTTHVGTGEGARDRPPDEEVDSGDGRGAAAKAVSDTGAVGSAGRILLSPSASTVVVEVDRSPNARSAVDPRAVAGEELREHGGKRSIKAGGDSQVAGKDVYSAQDLRAITAASRSTASGKDRPAIYILLLEGRYEDDSVTGVAFHATAFAVFPDQIGGGLLGTNQSTFETAVVVHEMGHLFGLVNLTGEGASHEDPEHPGHAASRDSVMYWAVEDVSIRNVFQGGPPTEFNAADREEMSRIRRT